MKKNWIYLLLILGLLSCQNNGKDKNNQSGKTVSLAGAGATFPMPYYNVVFKNYTNESGILVTYGGIGSGGGIRSLNDQVVDFGATDAFLDDKKLSEMPSEVIHIPTCIGAVVIAYNLPGEPKLQLSNSTLEQIFMGKITKWNDKVIQSDNPNIELPAIDITVVHRSDGSGTTYIFSDYMSKISSAWEVSVGKGKSLKWPIGIGAKGNPGVAGTIKQTTGAIGYIGSEYALAQKISIAKVLNSSGEFIEPSMESISAAASGELPLDTRVMLTNSDNPAAYPISGFTWIILYKEQAYNGREHAQAQQTLKFLEWMMGDDAQAIAPQVNYAPLPEKAKQYALELLGTLTYNGKTLRDAL